MSGAVKLPVNNTMASRSGQQERLLVGLPLAAPFF
jgi:hypothetical protein